MLAITLFIVLVCLCMHAAPGYCISCSSKKCHSAIVQDRDSHPVIKKCTNCHKNIAEGTNGQPGHSKAPLPGSKETCIQCHKKRVLDAYEFLHTPLEKQGCLVCHKMHKAPFQALLNDEYPGQDHVKYTKKEYSLCFKCHKRDLLMFPDTSYATGFRDGEKNLHYFHVKAPKKGETCFMCHAKHGSHLPHLMAKKVPFGRWKMPIGFKKHTDGGSCMPGCHEEKSYHRETSGGTP